MQIPIQAPGRQNIALQSAITAKFTEVLSKGIYLLGEETRLFEQEFADYCQCREGIAVANGTDALEIALRSLGCEPGDEVITAANAGGYTTTACLAIGAVPVYADVQEDLTLSPLSVLAALSARTKAVVVTHLYGKLADLPEIRRQLAPHAIALVEDCAQAHGALRAGAKAGSWGDISCFSFYPTKNLGAMGDGGAIVTNNGLLADRARQLRQYGWSEKYTVSLAHGRNSRLDELQAAVLRLKLPFLDGWNQRRREIVGFYGEALQNSALHLLHAPAPDYVAHLCVGRHPQREQLRQALAAKGIATAIHYPILDHQQPAMARAPWRQVELTRTEQALGEILTIPCFPEMSDAEVEYTAAALSRCC